jgi:cell division protein FtsX
MKHISFGLVASLLSAIYWWIIFTLVYADVLFASDRNPALPPIPDKDVLIHNITIIIIGVLIYTVAAVLWHRLIIKYFR